MDPRQPDEHGRKHREDISLDECDKQFKAVHEYPEYYRHDSHCPSYCRPELRRDEYHRHDAEDERMSRHYVGKQTDHQGERLCEHAEYLDYYEYRLQPQRHIRPEDVFPVMPVRGEIRQDECTHGQDESYRYVSRDIRSAGEERHYSHQVVYEDEEEHRQQVRGVFCISRPYGVLDDIIIDHGYHRLEKGGHPARSL